MSDAAAPSLDAPTASRPAPSGARDRPPRARVARWSFVPQGLDRLVLVAMLALAAVLLIDLPWSFDVDSWLALASGRAIWYGGLPHHETLTVLSYGVRVVDQQWLSQLASYGLYRIGGLGLLGLVNVGLIFSGVVVVLVAGQRRGVRLSVMLFMLILCLWQVMPFREVRTQAFAYPLIAATLVLLASDSRTPTRRVYWCLALLVLWANLHGTASIGAGLVALRGLLLGWERRGELGRARMMRGAWPALRRPLALVVGAPLTLLMTPYGLENISYYRSTLLNSTLQHSVTEWQPITSHLTMSVPFFILAALMVWSFGRNPERTTAWEKVTLLLLAMASIDVLRNDLLFGMAALLIVPASVNASMPPRRPRTAPVRERVNTGLAWLAVAVTLLAVAVTLLRPARDFERQSQRTGVVTVLRRAMAADPSLRILADVRYADWLLWRDPQLSGHIASDASFEVLTAAQLDRLQRTFSAIGPAWKLGARGYRLLVLNRSASGDAVRGFLEEPGARVLYRDSERIVILRSARAAA
jgi:hypothetical protein